MTKKLLDTTKEAKLKIWLRRGHIERADNFFFPKQIFFFFNFQYKKLHWYKIHMNNQQKSKSLLCLSLFQIPPSLKKMNIKPTLCIQITSRCTHFGFKIRQKHLSTYLSSTDYKTRNEHRKRFHFCFGSRQYLQRCKLPHGRKKKKKQHLSKTKVIVNWICDGSP